MRVSVLIPIRNEASHIKSLLDDLNAQSYANFEVIVIDDGSSDSSGEIVTEFKRKAKYALKLIRLEDEFHPSPKKKALSEGIQSAQGEIILTTDGDCSVGSEWIRCMVGPFQKQPISLVMGPVVYENTTGILGCFQMVEFASLIGLSGSTLNLGYPTFANGANLAFTKEIFNQVNGYSGNDMIPSGDDEFLLLKIFEQDEKSVWFNKDQNALISTFPKPDLPSFYNQRRRWASKWKIRGDKGIKFFVLWVFLVNLLTTYALTYGLFSGTGWFWWLMLLIKGTSDGIFLSKILSFLGKKGRTYPILLFELIHPFYLIIFGLMTNFGKYYWKGRRFK